MESFIAIWLHSSILHHHHYHVCSRSRSLSPLSQPLWRRRSSSFSFRFILSPVWWLTHVRDSDSPWQHYLTVPELLTFSGWQVEVSVTYLKGPFHPIQQRTSEWAAVCGNRLLFSHKLLFGSLWNSYSHLQPNHMCTHQESRHEQAHTHKQDFVYKVYTRKCLKYSSKY